MRYRIFISHAWAYQDTYWSIRAMLDRAKASYFHFDYVDYSIPDHNPILSAKGTLLTGPRLLAKAIQTRIDQSSVVLVPARMFVNHSDWVSKEIDYAVAKRYRVIAVRSRSTLRVPSELIQKVGSPIDANYRSLHAAITA